MNKDKFKTPSQDDYGLYKRWLESGGVKDPLDTEISALLERYRNFEFAQPDESDWEIKNRLRSEGFEFGGDAPLTINVDLSEEMNNPEYRIVVQKDKWMIFCKSPKPTTR